MRSSYNKEDVVLLLKDITGMVKPQPTLEREKEIQAGRHYSEMLPIEYVPGEKYMAAYNDALAHYGKETAEAVGRLADMIVRTRGSRVVLVSLARAGIPVGILIKHYIKWKYQLEVSHYAISIIRGRGIDDNAMQYILQRHQPGELLFVDGWIGKGAILGELEKNLKSYPGVSPELAVVADPANITPLCGTHADILIPSACLNATVSGLISRTFLREDIISRSDFHGAVYYGELSASDLSYNFIHAVEKEFVKKNTEDTRMAPTKGLTEVQGIAGHFGISDINLVKPGIGETTRVLLRRVPWKILISPGDRNDPALTHIFRLAEEKQVEIQEYPLKNYKACGMIKKLADA